MKPRREKRELSEGVEYRYSTDWIDEFESEPHWRLYWRQQKLMRDLVGRDDRVLEIGIGTQFAANYLRSKGVSVTTLDIDAGKQPDIVANVAHYDFPTAYDAILAFEIFEHIPYQYFCSVLPRLSAAAQRYVFLSFPRNRKVAVGLRVKLPKLKAKSLEWKVNKGRIDEPYHVWEVDHGGITVESLEQELVRHGFQIHRRDEAFDRLFYAMACPSMDGDEPHRV
jgi:Methyltransferase domain